MNAQELSNTELAEVVGEYATREVAEANRHIERSEDPPLFAIMQSRRGKALSEAARRLREMDKPVDDETIDRVAMAISGAPFPSNKSHLKAIAAIKALGRKVKV